MPTFTVKIGPTSQGRTKDTNKRHFATRLSSGKRLQVLDGDPVTVAVNDVDADTLQNLAGRDYISIEEVEERKPAAHTDRTQQPALRPSR